jgi:hypothetical protein
MTLFPDPTPTLVQIFPCVDLPLRPGLIRHSDRIREQRIRRNSEFGFKVLQVQHSEFVAMCEANEQLRFAAQLQRLRSVCHDLWHGFLHSIAKVHGLTGSQHSLTSNQLFLKSVYMKMARIIIDDEKRKYLHRQQLNEAYPVNITSFTEALIHHGLLNRDTDNDLIHAMLSLYCRLIRLCNYEPECAWTPCNTEPGPHSPLFIRYELSWRSSTPKQVFLENEGITKDILDVENSFVATHISNCANHMTDVITLEETIARETCAICLQTLQGGTERSRKRTKRQKLHHPVETDIPHIRRAHDNEPCRGSLTAEAKCTALSCGHIFHKACIEKHTRQAFLTKGDMGRCPLCRQAI